MAIGRALITQPAIVFADEPTGNLDTEAATEVLGLLTTAAGKYGQTVVVVTHDPHVAAHAGRVITLRDGQIISDTGGRK